MTDTYDAWSRVCFNKMRGSYSGNTLAFQANAESSILLPRSKFEDIVVWHTKQVKVLAHVLLA